MYVSVCVFECVCVSVCVCVCVCVCVRTRADALACIYSPFISLYNLTLVTALEVSDV